MAQGKLEHQFSGADENGMRQSVQQIAMRAEAMDVEAPAASAPAPKLYEHFGITAAKVAEAAEALKAAQEAPAEEEKTEEAPAEEAAAEAPAEDAGEEKAEG